MIVQNVGQPKLGPSSNEVRQGSFAECQLELAALAWLRRLGWQPAHGPDLAPDTPNAERVDYGQVVLGRRLRDTLAVLNPSLPIDALEDALRKLTRAGHRAGSAECDD